MTVSILQGDCREVLRTLPAESVHCVVTSPPYFGLRDYGCAGQIGLEPTPDAYVAELMAVFREVKRVLRSDGVVFLNLGDSYAAGQSNGGQSDFSTSGLKRDGRSEESRVRTLTERAKELSRAQPSSGSRLRMSNVSNLLARNLEGGVLLFGRVNPRCGPAESIHVLIDDEAAPNGVFKPLFRAQRITIQQGQDDFCEVGNTFDAPVTCWVRRALGAAVPNYADSDGGMNVGENTRVILAAGNLHADSPLRSAIARAVKNGKATFAVEIAGKPEAEGIASVVSVRDAFTIHTGTVRGAKIDAVDDPIALLDRADGNTSGGCYLAVRNATSEHVAFDLHGGADLRIVSVGHLTLLKDGGVTPYSTLLDKVTRKANTLLPKQELGIPDMVKRGLMEDGWICRQTIIWSKPNPMPESVRDRCTKAHEYIFLLSKSASYYYDADAIAEEVDLQNLIARAGGSIVRTEGNGLDTVQRSLPTGKARTLGIGSDGKRNRRSVWTVATQPYSEAHFATFPPALIEPCIKAGCPSGGTVLDPFGGAGTTGLVADRLQRNAILIELNPEYAAMAEKRVHGDCPMFANLAAAE